MSSTNGKRDATNVPPTGVGRRRKGPSCEQCFFGCHGLCALNLSEPCATFRPNRPEGLVPPLQPALLVREPLLTEAAA